MRPPRPGAIRGCGGSRRDFRARFHAGGAAAPPRALTAAWPGLKLARSIMPRRRSGRQPLVLAWQAPGKCAVARAPTVLDFGRAVHGPSLVGSAGILGGGRPASGLGLPGTGSRSAGGGKRARTRPGLASGWPGLLRLPVAWPGPRRGCHTGLATDSEWPGLRESWLGETCDKRPSAARRCTGAIRGPRSGRWQARHNRHRGPRRHWSFGTT